MSLRLKSWALLVGMLVGTSHAAAQSACAPPPDAQPVVALPAGSIIERVGTSDLTITSDSQRAKELTRQGFALIHCFWFNEAVRSFRDATREDPACAAAWLGLNIALTLPWHRPRQHQEEADYAIRRAVQLSGEASDVEQSLIAAFRLRSLRQDDRDSDFERAMDALIERHPEAHEPRLLLSAIRVQLCLGDGYDENGDLEGEMKKVLALIGPILQRDPDNPAALHYHIHALEGTDPAAALKSADRLGKAAPGSSHMIHMPGHIYNRLGLYQRAHEVFNQSKELDEQYYEQIPGSNRNTNWNYGHNLDYMIFNLSEMGRLREASELARESNFSLNRLHWRSAQWRPLSEPARRAVAEGRSPSPGALFFLGMAAVEAGELEEAEQHSAALQEEAAKRGQSRGRALTGDRVVQTQAAELRGWLLVQQGHLSEGIDQLKLAVDTFDRIAYEEPPYYIRPPHETLGHALILDGRYDEAVAAFERGLQDRPKNGWLLFGIGKAHEAAERTDAAKKAYEAFLEAWATADEDLPQVRAARAFLASR
jgi:tetratricopeptide (TPR) repeat protein